MTPTEWLLSFLGEGDATDGRVARRPLVDGNYTMTRLFERVRAATLFLPASTREDLARLHRVFRPSRSDFLAQADALRTDLLTNAAQKRAEGMTGAGASALTRVPASAQKGRFPVCLLFGRAGRRSFSKALATPRLSDTPSRPRRRFAASSPTRTVPIVRFPRTRSPRVSPPLAPKPRPCSARTSSGRDSCGASPSPNSIASSPTASRKTSHSTPRTWNASWRRRGGRGGAGVARRRRDSAPLAPVGTRRRAAGIVAPRTRSRRASRRTPPPPRASPPRDASIPIRVRRRRRRGEARVGASGGERLRRRRPPASDDTISKPLPRSSEGPRIIPNPPPSSPSPPRTSATCTPARAAAMAAFDEALDRPEPASDSTAEASAHSARDDDVDVRHFRSQRTTRSRGKTTRRARREWTARNERAAAERCEAARARRSRGASEMNKMCTPPELDAKVRATRSRREATDGGVPRAHRPPRGYRRARRHARRARPKPADHVASVLERNVRRWHKALASRRRPHSLDWRSIADAAPPPPKRATPLKSRSVSSSRDGSTSRGCARATTCRGRSTPSPRTRGSASLKARRDALAGRQNDRVRNDNRGRAREVARVFVRTDLASYREGVVVRFVTLVISLALAGALAARARLGPIVPSSANRCGAPGAELAANDARTRRGRGEQARAVDRTAGHSAPRRRSRRRDARSQPAGLRRDATASHMDRDPEEDGSSPSRATATRPRANDLPSPPPSPRSRGPPSRSRTPPPRTRLVIDALRNPTRSPPRARRPHRGRRRGRRRPSRRERRGRGAVDLRGAHRRRRRRRASAPISQPPERASSGLRDGDDGIGAAGSGGVLRRGAPLRPPTNRGRRRAWRDVPFVAGVLRRHADRV